MAIVAAFLMLFLSTLYNYFWLFVAAFVVSLLYSVFFSPKEGAQDRVKWMKKCINCDPRLD